MKLEQKILLASIRELNEMVELAALTDQQNLVNANIITLKERIVRYGNNYPGTSNNRIKPYTD